MNNLWHLGYSQYVHPPPPSSSKTLSSAQLGINKQWLPIPLPHLQVLPIGFQSLWIYISSKWDHTGWGLLWLASPTEHSFKIHPCGSLCQNSFILIFYCLYIWCYILFIHPQTSGWFPPGGCEWSCSDHGCTCIWVCPPILHTKIWAHHMMLQPHRSNGFPLLLE